jgi:hypothetical protein
MAEFVKVASTNEIAPGQGRLVTVKGRDIALFNVDGKFNDCSEPWRRIDIFPIDSAAGCVA